jgi:hypothetical protein
LHPDQVKVGHVPRSSLVCNKNILCEIPLMPKYSKEDRQMDGIDNANRQTDEEAQADREKADRQRGGGQKKEVGGQEGRQVGRQRDRHEEGPSK